MPPSDGRNTADGVIRSPRRLGIISGRWPFMYATSELVVPKSIPTAMLITCPSVSSTSSKCADLLPLPSSRDRSPDRRPDRDRRAATVRDRALPHLPSDSRSLAVADRYAGAVRYVVAQCRVFSMHPTIRAHSDSASPDFFPATCTASLQTRRSMLARSCADRPPLP